MVTKTNLHTTWLNTQAVYWVWTNMVAIPTADKRFDSLWTMGLRSPAPPVHVQGSGFIAPHRGMRRKREGESGRLALSDQLMVSYQQAPTSCVHKLHLSPFDSHWDWEWKDQVRAKVKGYSSCSALYISTGIVPNLKDDHKHWHYNLTPLSALRCVLPIRGVCCAVYGYVVARFMTVTQYVCESNLVLCINHTKVCRRPDIHSHLWGQTPIAIVEELK